MGSCLPWFVPLLPALPPRDIAPNNRHEKGNPTHAVGLHLRKEGRETEVFTLWAACAFLVGKIVHLDAPTTGQINSPGPRPFAIHPDCHPSPPLLFPTVAPGRPSGPSAAPRRAMPWARWRRGGGGDGGVGGTGRVTAAPVVSSGGCGTP